MIFFPHDSSKIKWFHVSHWLQYYLYGIPHIYIPTYEPIFRRCGDDRMHERRRRTVFVYYYSSTIDNIFSFIRLRLPTLQFYIILTMISRDSMRGNYVIRLQSRSISLLFLHSFFNLCSSIRPSVHPSIQSSKIQSKQHIQTTQLNPSSPPPSPKPKQTLKMPLLPTSNPPHNTSSSSTTSTSNIDAFPQNPTSEARGKDAIDAKNKKSNEKKTAEEVENERLYEERIEEEYAKREGGA